MPHDHWRVWKIARDLGLHRWARGRVLISGHPAQDRAGRLIGPYGQLGRDLTTEEGYEAARAVALPVMANLRDRIGPLEQVAGWTRVLGMVNSVPGYTEQHLVMNGFSDLVLDVFGPEVGQHSRPAMGRRACR